MTLRISINCSTGYHNGAMGLGSYAKKLSTLSPTDSLVLDQFLAADAMESKIDFTHVDQERRTVVEKLAGLLNDNEVNELLQQSIAYRMGHLSYGAYYGGLRNLCQNHGLNLARTPAFDDYIRYVLLADGINAEDLFSSVEKLEDAVMKKLVSTPEQKRLMEASESLTLAGKLIRFELTPKNGKDTESCQLSSIRCRPPT